LLLIYFFFFIHKSNLLYQIGLEADKNISIANNSEKK